MEYITANGVEYAVTNVVTSVDTITFITQEMDVKEMESTFRKVTKLTVSGEDRTTIYGRYENLSFESASVLANGDVTVTMHIPSAEELRIAELESKVAEMENN